MPAAFDVSEVHNLADDLRAKADDADRSLSGQFETWVEGVAEIMRDEVPVASGETRDSIEVQYEDELVATIGPTNTDDYGRPVGFFINYGRGGQAPDDFIGRTGSRVDEPLSDFDVSEVL